MNKQKFHQLTLLLLMVAFSMPVLTAVTQNQSPEPTRSETPAEEATPAEDQTGDVDQDPQQAEENTPPVNAPPAKPIKQFKPTEQIQADSAVSFPIDI